MNDALVIARDIAGDASQKAANKVRPSEEQLSQVDQAADDNVWHEKPDVSGYKEQFKSRFSKKKDDAADVANTGVEAGTTGSTLDPYAGVNAAAENAQSKVPEDQKSSLSTRTQEYKNRTKNYLSDKFPQERRDQAIYRLKKMIMEIQGHRDCKIQAIITIREFQIGTNGATQTSKRLKHCLTWPRSTAVVQDTRSRKVPAALRTPVVEARSRT